MRRLVVGATYAACRLAVGRPYTDAVRATAHALVPVKAFADGKSRLADVLGRDERRELALALAHRSIQLLVSERPTTVVANDDEVLALATSLGAVAHRCSGPGLDLAVTEGTAELVRQAVRRCIVVHSDLPLLDTVDDLDVDSGVVIATDRHGGGTNAIGLDPATDVRWAYGAGSLHRHRAEALRLGLAVTRVRRAALSFDLDTEDDLRTLHRRTDTDHELRSLLDRLLADHAPTGAT